MRKIILTGDRPTGCLHIGHYAGSLKNRVKFQESGLYDTFIMIADHQALTDHAKNPALIRKSVFEVALDYLAVGIDPSQSTILIQSQIPELHELTMLFLNLVTVSRLSRNPTVKTEIKQKQFGDSIPAGFLIYPVSQAADITAFKATTVPVGSDQLPMIEQTKELVRSFNQAYGEVLTEPEALLPNSEKEGRLVGLDGKSKMSKSLGNAIFLSDEADEIQKKIMGMFTDPNHIRVEDPGQVAGNPVFDYLEAFCSDKEVLEGLKAHYQRGGLGDMKVKRYLNEILQAELEPIRARRKMFEKDPVYIQEVLRAGTETARSKVAETLTEVRQAIGLDYFR